MNANSSYRLVVKVGGLLKDRWVIMMAVGSFNSTREVVKLEGVRI